MDGSSHNRAKIFSLYGNHLKEQQFEDRGIFCGKKQSKVAKSS